MRQAASMATPQPVPRWFTGEDCFEQSVAYLVNQLPSDIHLATPLGLGKPHRLLNALYDTIAQAPKRQLHIYTALSLDVPQGKTDMERRFLAPFVKRVYGEDFPRLSYIQALKTDTLPANIHIQEFYMQSGALLSSVTAQSDYASLNYTHVPKALAERGINVVFQKVAKGKDGRLSLSCNTDTTIDTLEAIAKLGRPRPLMVAEVDSNLPYIGGCACVPADFFDIIIEPPHSRQLFVLPRQPVTLVDYAIGFYASTLIKDGGTLQIGIGALADAVCYALVLRQQDNAKYQAILNALNPAIFDPTSDIAKLIAREGGIEPFNIGLYGASEMMSEGFKLLVQQGILKRKVVDDTALMQRINAGTASDSDREQVAREGQYLHGAFYLGSPDFYQWLRTLSDGEKSAIAMLPITAINSITGKHYEREVAKRQHARFINTCIIATLLGGAISETLDHGGVVSGVGGQYNFVSMAHELPDARSVLMFRATREYAGELDSNIRFEGGHLTIPRHLRDIFITEYGIADIRYQTDSTCVNAMLSICHSEFQQDLYNKAYENKKVKTPMPQLAADNTHEALFQRLQPFYQAGSLPDYPLGSDFDATEQRLVKALTWLKAKTDTKAEFATTLAQLAVSDFKYRFGMAEDTTDSEALARMGLGDTDKSADWNGLEGLEVAMSAKLLDFALKETQRNNSYNE